MWETAEQRSSDQKGRIPAAREAPMNSALLRAQRRVSAMPRVPLTAVNDSLADGRNVSSCCELAAAGLRTQGDVNDDGFLHTGLLLFLLSGSQINFFFPPWAPQPCCSTGLKNVVDL